MELLPPDIIKHFIEHYFGLSDSLALLCVSKKFYAYQKFYSKHLSNAQQGLLQSIKENDLKACQIFVRSHQYNIHADDEYAFRTSCQYGRLEIAKWVNQFHHVNIHILHDFPFRWSCGNGHLDVAKWLYLLGLETNSPIDLHISDEDSFKHACRNGHLDVAKWLFNLSLETESVIVINSQNEYAFRRSCKYGYLDIAQWLVSLGDKYSGPNSLIHSSPGLGPNKKSIIDSDEKLINFGQNKKSTISLIDIHAYDEYAFVQCCCRGWLDIAKWLVELGNQRSTKINIHVNNYYAFRHSYHNGHTNIVRWLIQISEELQRPIRHRIIQTYQLNQI